MHYKEVKGILSARNGMNLCRGCTHGCIYCDSRSQCYNMEHDFEDVQIKINAAELLEEKLRSKRRPCIIGTGAMSDPYIPIKESLALTRSCLQIIEKYGFGLAIQTKSDLILDDLDLLESINKRAKCVVQITLTTLDEDLCRIVEPNVSSTIERVEALKKIRDRGITTVVWLGPLLPFLNDTPENLKGILDYCIEAGVYGIVCFGMGMTLRHGSREYYYKNLDKLFPGLKYRYMKKYGNNYIITSENNSELLSIFQKTCSDHNIVHNMKDLFSFIGSYEEKPASKQLELF